MSYDAVQQYNAAMKAGEKYYKSCVHDGKYPYLSTLDYILDNSSAVKGTDLGIIDIPTELIVGTKTEGRTTGFAGNFMPILSHNTEFAAKWISLCDAHLSESGIRDAIKCYEYLGRFYVLEGNKRVSVLKHFGAPTISGHVERIVPELSNEPEAVAYYEFTEFYKKSRTYLFRFDKPGQYSKLQAALGFDADHVWTEDEQRAVRSAFAFFRATLSKHHPGQSQTSISYAFLVWLQLYSISEIREMSESELAGRIAGIWPQVLSNQRDGPITMSTQEPVAPTSLLAKLTEKSHIQAAFVYETEPENSSWSKAHEEGRLYAERELRKAVTTMAYSLHSLSDAETVIEKAISDGAEVVFTTTPSMINGCRRIAAKHSGIKIFNCSVSMPFPGVRTYYSRIHEGKFVSGAIAGALCKDGNIGYIASNPIFGVPASINAFALGAMMTNPDSRIKLVWSCTEEKPVETLLEQGITVISNRDVPLKNQPMETWGLCRLDEQGKLTSVASPYWNWGSFYFRILRSILNGSWNGAEGSVSGTAVNLWWGMLSGTVGMRLSDELPEGVHRLGDILKSSLKNGSLDPFHAKITDQNGIIKNDGTRTLSAEEIISMDWLCDRVEGYIPPFDELLPKSRETVRLLGIYRDSIPPEKGGILL